MASFQLYDFNISDVETNDGDDNPFIDHKQFIIQAFGINEKKETVSITISDFKPYLYIRIPDQWAGSMKHKLLKKIRSFVGSYYADSIISRQCKIVKHKQLYGFDGGRKYKFFKIVFQNTRALYKVKNMFCIKQCKDPRCGEWNATSNKTCCKCSTLKGGVEKKGLDKPAGFSKDWGFHSPVIDEAGYKWGKTNYYLYSYEANIPPLLRFFHITEISPSGWVTFDTTNEISPKTTTCTYEYACSYLNIKPVVKDTIVSYKIMSFDIEAASSHLEFPLPIKTYKKLAVQIVDLVHKDKTYTPENITESLTLFVHAAFKLATHNQIDVVYPKKTPSRTELDVCIQQWLTTVIPTGQPLIHMNNPLEDDLEEDEEDEKANQKVYMRPKSTVIDLLLNNKIHRSTKVLGLENSFWHEEKRQLFPGIKGDHITFIGSTFVNHGEEKPYLNHCVALGTCDDIDNIEVVQCKTEADLLVEWMKIVQKENPDIVIGYNIFGFDYDYILKRAKECGTKCLTSLVKLSKNIDEKCIVQRWDNPEWKLKETTTFLASGEHTLSYFPMPGRIQIDLLNLFRREHNLSSYKLDYVSGHFIGDKVKQITPLNGNTAVYSANLSGLDVGSYIHFEETGYSTEYYNCGSKHNVIELYEDHFVIAGEATPDFTKSVRWCLAKDDVTPQDIFRLSEEGPKERAIVAKYCIQDCNLVHQLLQKLDIITGFIEMSKICSVPMNFLVLRGQGIKLTSFIAKKCREKDTLMPDIKKDESNDGYEGAIVLEPKTAIYNEDPVACVDYSSLYPSSMISENLCHSSKVWTKEYNLENELIKETGEKSDETGLYLYDDLPNYKYVDITYDTYTYKRKTPSAAALKIKIGYKICRFAQYKEGKAIMPSVLEELLKQRKATKKQMAKETDPFMKNVLDKRQLSIKLTANSLYGQCGAKTSTFYEKDVAASTTATGRKLLTYGKRVIEEVYGDKLCNTSTYGQVLSKAEYIYGDTDSIFFTFHLEELDGSKILGKKALEITIELAQEAGKLATQFLKAPHDLEYEKTFLPFILLSKKRYVGMLYEFNIEKGKRKEMGIVLKRRDNAPIVKDVYGGVIEILMKGGTVAEAITFTQGQLQMLVDGKIPMSKLIVTKSLRSNYKNPAQIAHNVLAERIGSRDPGNKPSSGDRIAYVYVKNPNKKALQGERIETPEYIIANNIAIDYGHYITNQIMKPLLQVFVLVLDEIPVLGADLLQKRKLEKEMIKYKKELDPEKFSKKEEQLKNKIVKALIFDKIDMK